MLLNRPIKTRFRYGYTWRLNLATQSNSLTHYAKGTRSNLRSKGQTFNNLNSSSTACKQTVSGTISLPSPGYFSPFPHGTSSLSVAGVYLALGDGPPRFPQGSTCPAVLGYFIKQVCSISLTGLSPSMVRLSSLFCYWSNFWLAGRSANPPNKAPQHRIYNACRLDIHSVWAVPISLAATLGIAVAFYS